MRHWDCPSSRPLRAIHHRAKSGIAAAIRMVMAKYLRAISGPKISKGRSIPRNIGSNRTTHLCSRLGSLGWLDTTHRTSASPLVQRGDAYSDEPADCDKEHTRPIEQSAYRSHEENPSIGKLMGHGGKYGPESVTALGRMGDCLSQTDVTKPLARLSNTPGRVGVTPSRACNR